MGRSGEAVETFPARLREGHPYAASHPSRRTGSPRPIEQGEQLFIALKRLGREAQFIRFPGADHNLSRSGHPHLRVKRLSHIIRWFVEHIEK